MKKLTWFYRKIIQIIKVIKETGVIFTVFKGIEYILFYKRRMKCFPAEYEINQEELTKQIESSFSYSPLISVVVPVYNTNEDHLCEMIDSVRTQTYANLELCLFNGGSTNSNIDVLINNYTKIDSRIVYCCEDINYGISGNTNKAIELATGEYICLLDHDDLLAPSALYECVKLLNDNRVDMIYTDEDKISECGKINYSTHKKPDWSPDTLLSYNYICHLAMFRKDLLPLVGEFRDTFDGSQDFDFLLRLSLHADAIAHIPKVLYHWRVSISSTADNIFAKSYAINAGKRALECYLSETPNVNFKVYDSAFIGAHRTRFKLNKCEKVLIIVYGEWRREEKALETYNHIKATTEWDDFEIVLVSTNNFTIKQMRNIHFIDKKEVAVKFNEIIKTNTSTYTAIMDYRVRILNSNWCEILVSELQDTYISIISSKVLRNKSLVQSYGLAVVKDQIINMNHFYHRRFLGYMGRNQITQNVSAVTPHLILTKTEIVKSAGYFRDGYSSTNTILDFCFKCQRLNGFVKIIPDELFMSKYNPIKNLNKDLELLYRSNSDLISTRDRYYPIEMIK